MTAAISLPATNTSRSDSDAALPGGRELLGIFGFWLLFAVVNLTNMLFPSGDGPPASMASVAAALIYALLWAVATIPTFWLTRRYSIETPQRVRRIVLFAVVGLGIALAVDVGMELIRHNVLPPPPRGRFRGGRGGGSMWIGVRGHLLNEYMVFAAMAAAGIARDYFIRYQRRLAESAALQAQLAEARLSALRNQLNPHFLFNTLNAVAALVERDPTGVRRMIARLSDLLRATLASGAESEAPLSRELALTSRYLDILQIRFQGRLETSIDAPSDLHDALVPPLVLQPLVENAMNHAVGQTSAPSRIDVRVFRDGYDLVMQVADTGSGGARRESEGAGIGLPNTRARLRQLYRDEQELALAANERGGTTVTIRLPYHTSPLA